MEKPRITPWNEDKKAIEEEFIVAKAIRIALPGKPAKRFLAGDKVTLSGGVKKDLYFQNKIFYPKDYDPVKAYEKAMKETYKAAVAAEGKETNESTNPSVKDVTALKKENAELKKAHAELSAKVDELLKGKK